MAYSAPLVHIIARAVSAEEFTRGNPSGETSPRIPCVRVRAQSEPGRTYSIEYRAEALAALPAVGDLVSIWAEVSARPSNKKFADGRSYSPFIDFLYVSAYVDTAELLPPTPRDIFAP